MKHGLKGKGGEGKIPQKVLAPSLVIDFLVGAILETRMQVCLNPDRGSGGLVAWKHV